MARQYNVAERLKNANQKPILTIDDEHVYKINNSTQAAIAIEAVGKDEKKGDFERQRNIMAIALGKEATDYIISLDLTVTAESMIINSIMAAIADMELEELEAKIEEERFHSSKRKKSK